MRKKTNAEQLKNYLEVIAGWGLRSFEGYVLHNGKAYTDIHSGVGKGIPRQCFMNAWQMVDILRPALTYVEGYAVRNGLIPVLHAWTVDVAGTVLDPTWDDGVAYYGVEFERELVLRTIIARGYYGVIDNMQQGYPLVRKWYDDHAEALLKQPKRKRRTIHVFDFTVEGKFV